MVAAEFFLSVHALRLKTMESKHPTGVGLGLRWELLDDVLDAGDSPCGKIRFFEISPENYMRRGGFSPNALARIAERYPLTTHGLTMSLGGTDPLDAQYFEDLATFLRRFDTGWHSDHLSFSGGNGVLLHDLLPVPFTSPTAKRIAARVREATERLEKQMAVENVSYYLTLGRNALDEEQFIRGILERADCGLLLDLNNLDVNAKNHGFDAWAWLERIPLEKVVEIHVAGPELWPNGLLIDTHGSPVRDSVHDLLRWVIERKGPVPILLERDNNVPSFDELLGEVERLDAVYQAALRQWQTQGEASRDA